MRDPLTTPPSFATGVTRYGASTANPAQAAAVVRSLAARHGLVLSPISTFDGAVVVLAADAWCLVTRSTSLSTPARYGPVALAVLQTILERAAGQHRTDLPAVLSEVCSEDPLVIATVDSYVEWARTHVGADAPLVLTIVARDLCSAGPRTQFAAVAEVLRIAADNFAAARDE